MKARFRSTHKSCIVKLDHTWYITMIGGTYGLTKDREAATMFTQSTLPDFIHWFKNIQLIYEEL